jgi:hypothetical protein
VKTAAADDDQAERLPGFTARTAPSAIGTAPSSAAIVVIMIGRKRIRQPGRWPAPACCPGARRRARSRSRMIAFFSTMPISMIMPTKA